MKRQNILITVLCFLCIVSIGNIIFAEENVSTGLILAIDSSESVYLDRYVICKSAKRIIENFDSRTGIAVFNFDTKITEIGFTRYPTEKIKQVLIYLFNRIVFRGQFINMDSALNPIKQYIHKLGIQKNYLIFLSNLLTDSSSNHKMIDLYTLSNVDAPINESITMLIVLPESKSHGIASANIITTNKLLQCIDQIETVFPVEKKKEKFPKLEKTIETGEKFNQIHLIFVLKFILRLIIFLWWRKGKNRKNNVDNVQLPKLNIYVYKTFDLNENSYNFQIRRTHFDISIGNGHGNQKIVIDNSSVILKNHIRVRIKDCKYTYIKSSKIIKVDGFEIKRNQWNLVQSFSKINIAKNIFVVLELN